jgi:hypothetical protein
MHPGRICRCSKGDKKGILIVREKVTNSYDGPGMKQRKLFLYSGAFKTCADLWEGNTWAVLEHQ